MISLIRSTFDNVCAVYQNHRLILSVPIAFINLTALFSLFHGASTVNKISMMIGAGLLLSSHIIANIIIHSNIQQRGNSVFNA